MGGNQCIILEMTIGPDMVKVLVCENGVRLN